MSNPETTGTERGQILILMVLMVGVLFLLVMAVVDVGFFIVERQRVQAAADAAALAGAHELPDDANLAQQAALDYVEANGIDSSNIGITFGCTSPEGVCDEGAGIYDTIYVTPTSKAPAFFGGILNLFGAGESCWVDGCNVAATAGACRGACGAVGNGPADIVVILDHSGSMSNGDLVESKDAILSMFESLNHQFQQVSAAFTPPVTPGDYCDSIDDWGDPMVWLPAPLTDTFQTSPGVLNYLSPPVDAIDCVDRTGGPWWDPELPGVHTNLGDPLQAAMNELIANGRPEVTWGIVLVTDGAANVAPDAENSTGQHSCSSDAPVTSGSGDNDGFESDSGDACANGGDEARDEQSGTSNSVSCNSSTKDRHEFWDFGVQADIPSGETIEGIEIRLDAWEEADEADLRMMCVELSWDGGSSWTSADSFNVDDNETTYIVGGATDTWGHSWTWAEMSDANFRVRVTNVADDSDNEFRLDYVAAEVYYSQTGGGYAHTGPCDWAAYWADQAKAAGIEIYTIAWGATNKCSYDDPSSPWYDVDAVDFLEALATDSSHFFNEPKSADLEPIF